MAKKRQMSSAGVTVVNATTSFLKSVGYILLVVGIALVLSTTAIVVANDVLALVKPDNDVAIKFEYDLSSDEMADLLKDYGIIDYAFVFKLFTSIKEINYFKSGTYDLNSNMDYGQIISELRREKMGDVVEITIPEGYTVRQIAELMEENRVCSIAEFMNTANTYDFSHSVLKDLPFRENRLEGYLFPDTYQFYVNEKTVSVINKMLNNFEKRYTDAMRAITEKNGQTIDEILVMASLIEKEAKWASERTMIAGVIYNRLNAPDRFPKLQIDATLLYVTGHKDKLTAEDLLIDSPYNTYLYEGLPPTAICNPGLNAILAAISPEANNYYYYVADPETGGHVFSRTLAEHNQAVANMNKKYN